MSWWPEKDERLVLYSMVQAIVSLLMMVLALAHAVDGGHAAGVLDGTDALGGAGILGAGHLAWRAWRDHA